MDYNYRLMVPAGTTVEAPAELSMVLTAGIIVEVRVGFPDGCADLVHVVIRDGLHQVWPTNTEFDYSWNDYTYVMAESYAVEAHPFTLTVAAWNEDVWHGHTVTVGLNMLPLDPTLLGRLVQALLGRPSRIPRL